MAVKKKNFADIEVTPTIDEGVVNSVEIKEDTPEVEVKTPEIDIDLEASKNSHRKEGNVKIRMRVDHRCTIAMEHYDLKAGNTYVVPENVKRILNNAGLLAPL